MTFGNLCGSLFFAAVLVKCKMFPVGVSATRSSILTDSGIISTEPYISYAQEFALYVFSSIIL